MAMTLYGNLLPGHRSDNMLSPHVRFQIALNNPLAPRCAEISRIIEEGSVKDLQVIFPLLVESIFGFNNQPGWGLKTVSRIVQPRDYDALRQFLSPEGSLLKLVYKLMTDTCVRYEFPISCLPSPTRRVLEEGVIPMLYVNKLQPSAPGRAPMSLCLNAFEYFIFHLSYCLVNPFNQKTYSNWTVPAEAVYPSVIDDYLQYFLPTDGSSVPTVHLVTAARTPLPPSPSYNSNISNYSGNYTPQRAAPSQLHLLKNRSAGKAAVSSPPLPEPSHVEIWRTETIVEVFIEIWLTQNSECTPGGFMPVSQETFFPNFDHVRIVRMLVKHVHYFSNNCLVGSANPLDELKRKIIPHLLQKKLYSFLQYSIANWPLDASFRLILETWLSYIQPWRYLYSKAARAMQADGSEERDRRVGIIWSKFITDNLMFYTVIFQRMLPRFFRMNLSTPKNAYMLYRVAKVFSQPDLHDMIAEAECSLHEPTQRLSRLAPPHNFVSSPSSSLSTAVVSAGQQLVELERPGYQYTALFGEEVRLQIRQLLLLVVQARLVAQAMLDLSDNGNCGLLSRVKKAFVSLFDSSGYPQGMDEYSPLDNRKVDVHLELATHHLCNLFNVEVPIIHRNGLIGNDESEASCETTCSRSSCRTVSTIYSEEDNFLNLQNKFGNRQKEIRFHGNPDLQPICSYEIGILVRWLYQLSSYLNTKYRLQLRNLYHRRDFVGHLCKQFLEEPIIYYEFRKNVYPPVRQQNVLPPRLSFRCIAHKQTLGYLSGGFLLAYLWWGYNPVLVMLAVLGSILVWAVIKAAALTIYHYKEP